MQLEQIFGRCILRYTWISAEISSLNLIVPLRFVSNFNDIDDRAQACSGLVSNIKLIFQSIPCTIPLATPEKILTAHYKNFNSWKLSKAINFEFASQRIFCRPRILNFLC